MSDFDVCYGTWPDFSHKPSNFITFWKEQLAQLKSIPHSVDYKKRVSRHILTENNSEVSFLSADRTRISAELLIPRKLIGKPPVVVIFHDYHEEEVAFKPLLNAGIAQLVVRMRKIDVEAPPPEPPKSRFGKQPPPQMPKYFAHNLTSAADHYLAKLFLDAYRALEVLRLNDEVDHDRIGIWGSGIGAAMGLFVTTFMRRTTYLVLENPGFCMLPKAWPEIEQGALKEVKDSMPAKSPLPKEFNYLDSIFLARELEVNASVMVQMNHNPHWTAGGFSLFHTIKAEKEMHLYSLDPKDNQEAVHKDMIEQATSLFCQALLR